MQHAPSSHHSSPKHRRKVGQHSTKHGYRRQPAVGVFPITSRKPTSLPINGRRTTALSHYPEPPGISA